MGTTHPSLQVSYVTEMQSLEERLRGGLLAGWDTVVAADPTAAFFQGTAWCVEWYRAYSDSFNPLVVCVRSGETLVGVIPLALEVSTGRLTFASDNMADYRDVVALPEHREAVVAELLRMYAEGAYPNPLRVGPTHPESLTTGLILRADRALRARPITSSHPCWRLWFGCGRDVGNSAGKESVRRHLNYYRQRGSVTLERAAGGDEWDAFKHEFFEQHSLRQLMAGRPVSFDDARKRDFYDALIRRHPSSAHVTALRAGGKLIAGHFGYVWRDVLHWGASAFDVTEEKHSPGQILIALLLESARAEGLRGVDFTLGTEKFKSRFGNDRVFLPSVELYPTARRYYGRKFRNRAVAGVKALVVRGGDEQRRERLTRLGRSLAEGAREFRARGAQAALRGIYRGVARTGRSGELVFTATPETFRQSSSALSLYEACVHNKNQVGDLLRYEDESAEVEREISAAVKSAAKFLRSGGLLHTILIDEQLAGWAWSFPHAQNTSGGQSFSRDEQASVSIRHVYVLPKYRQRGAAQALLYHISHDIFTGGAPLAYATCPETGGVLRKALEEVGFHALSIR
jgi:CelD/BcsL family acetyltransferase involved in cellulose biosynthesis/GNAT superfamily N-acetyltransferase